MASLEEVQKAKKLAAIRAKKADLTQAPDRGRRAGQGQGESYSFGEAGRAVDDFVRGMADTFTFGLADEAAAGANTLTGLGEGESYEENLAVERERDREGGAARTAGQITGALTGAAGLGRAGVGLMQGAQPTVKSLAGRGAAEGALYGGAYGAGSAEGGTQQRAEGALWGSLLGALTGAGTGAVAGKMAQAGRPKAPSVKQLKTQAGRAYDRALNTGVTLKQPKFAGIADDLTKAAKSEGFDVGIHPKVARALSRFDEAAGGTPSLQEVENLRRVLKQAAASNEKAERRLAGVLTEKLDDALRGLSPDDVVAGDVREATAALGQARQLWQRASKGDTIEGLIRRAEDRAAQYSGSGMENALRTEFRQLAMNEKKMRLFSPAEREAIKRVGQGAPLANILRALGKFAPTGVVSSTLSGGAGYAIGGPVGAVALPTAGFAGRAGATALTRGAANRAAEVMRAGGSASAAPPLLPVQKNALEALLLSQSQQNVNTLAPMLPSRGR